MNELKNKILDLINKFDGSVSIYACDNYNNFININENLVVETASCIKVFILVEFYRQIMNNQKSREDILVYNYENDYLTKGSGIIQYLDGGLALTSKNMAILMTIISDNIATSKMIEYLGFDNINNTINELNFTKTKLIAKKLDFNLYSKVGETTAYEYACLFKMLLNNEILTPKLCKEIIDILSNQQYNQMLTSKISPQFLEKRGSISGFINYIASKSGGLGDEGKKDIVNCRNDGGIISTKYGEYIVSIFINNFKDHYFYSNNPATLLGSEINKILFEAIEKNNGKFIS